MAVRDFVINDQKYEVDFERKTVRRKKGDYMTVYSDDFFVHAPKSMYITQLAWEDPKKFIETVGKTSITVYTYGETTNVKIEKKYDKTFQEWFGVPVVKILWEDAIKWMDHIYIDPENKYLIALNPHDNKGILIINGKPVASIMKVSEKFIHNNKYLHKIVDTLKHFMTLPKIKNIYDTFRNINYSDKTAILSFIDTYDGKGLLTISDDIAELIHATGTGITKYTTTIDELNKIFTAPRTKETMLEFPKHLQYENIRITSSEILYYITTWDYISYKFKSNRVCLSVNGKTRCYAAKNIAKALKKMGVV